MTEQTARQAAVTWKEYVDSQLVAIERTLHATATALETRLTAMNEFRHAISEQRESLERRMADCINRQEYHTQQQSLERQVGELREIAAESRGKASQNQVLVAYAVSGIALVSSIVSIVQGFFKG